MHRFGRLCAKVLTPGFLILTMFALPAVGQEAETMTPLLLEVQDNPIPFRGSDGQTHLVYELWMKNFTSADIAVEQVEVMGDGVVLQTLGAKAIAGSLQAAGVRESGDTLAKSAQALLFLHVALKPGAEIPRQLSHRVTLMVSAAPPDHRRMSEDGGISVVDRQRVALIGPPLRGMGYLSADSCCDAVRHTRAALPVNGRVWVAQRYAVDWEQLDTGGHVYVGPREKLESYTIFGKPVLAVADGLVEAAINHEPEQIPGAYPTNIAVDKADGNYVTLNIGSGHYALYAHMQPGSVRVNRGQRIKRGDVIGLVGNSGNSVAPHLHFQMIDRPSSLASNGLPYEVSNFEVTGASAGTKAFDDAEANGTPLPFTPISPALPVHDALPLDQLLITFPEPLYKVVPY